MTDTDPTSFERQLRSGLAQEADRLSISAGLTERTHARIDQRNRHRHAGGIAAVTAVTVITIAAIVVPRVGQSHSRVPTTVPKRPAIGMQLARLNANGDVAISGTTLVVGRGGGHAYVFTKSAAGWTQTAQLQAAEPKGGSDAFSWGAVAISGNTIVLGGPGQFGDPRPSHDYLAYVFTKTATGWAQTAELKIASRSYSFAVYSVATSGTYVVVGTTYGPTYVFTKTATGWTQGVELETQDMVLRGIESVAVSGTTVVAQALPHQGDLDGASVFAKSRAGWTRVAELKVAAGQLVDSVAISGKTAIVGTFTNGGAHVRSYAYVFTETATGWTHVADLKASYYGTQVQVAISGNTVVVGANGYPSGPSGRAYIFTRTGASWTRVAELKGPDTGVGEYFGLRVAISGTSVVVGEFVREGHTFVFQG